MSVTNKIFNKVYFSKFLIKIVYEYFLRKRVKYAQKTFSRRDTFVRGDFCTEAHFARMVTFAQK